MQQAGKSALTSSTVWGGIIAIAPLIAQVVGIDQQMLSSTVAAIVSAAGGILSIWGRIKASQIIRGIF